MIAGQDNGTAGSTAGSEYGDTGTAGSTVGFGGGDTAETWYTVGALAVAAIADGCGDTEGPAYKRGLAILQEVRERHRLRRAMLARFGRMGNRSQHKVKAHAIIKRPRMRPGAWAKRQERQENTR